MNNYDALGLIEFDFKTVTKMIKKEKQSNIGRKQTKFKKILK